MVDPIAARPAPGAPLRLRTVAVPAGASILRPSRDGGPLLSRGTRAASGERPQASEDTFIYLEPIDRSPRRRLLMLRGAGAAVPRLNGGPAPAVCLLQDGDQILLGDDVLLHVTTYRRPPVGPAGRSFAGRECLLCRTTVRPGDTVYACPCGAVLHVDSVAGEGREPLQCARLQRECSRCSNEIVLTEGYSHVPDC